MQEDEDGDKGDRETDNGEWELGNEERGKRKETRLNHPIVLQPSFRLVIRDW